MIMDAYQYGNVYSKGDNNMKQMSEELYDELSRTLTDFENATDDDTDENWLSDGEWLDVFYDFCVKLQREINK